MAGLPTCISAHEQSFYYTISAKNLIRTLQMQLVYIRTNIKQLSKKGGMFLIV